MLLKKIVLLALVLSTFQQGFSQLSGRKFEELKNLNGRIEVSVSDGKYLIVPFSDKIVHTTFYPKGKEVKNFSYAVDMDPEDVAYKIDDAKSKAVIVINKLKVTITKTPFQISYSYNGKNLISERKGYLATDTSQILDFEIEKDEILYGGGARVLGMNRRGHRLQLYNRAHYGYGTHSELMNYSLPVFLSSKKYAVLFDNASSGFLDLDSKKENSINYETVGGTMNYHVIAGDDWYDLVEQYTKLTGRQPLPPRWAFGNISSRFGYHSQKETEETIAKYFEEDIPVDAVILDIYWFGKEIKGTMGNLEWYRDSFPNPEKMIADFNKKGVKTILITEPFVLTTSTRWNEAVKEKVLAVDSTGKPYRFDFYFGNTGLIDVFDPKARSWFWNIYKKFANQGVEGWWGDLGEPEVHPADIIHVNGTGDEVHNAYGQEWARIVFDGYKNDFPEKRPFILMRAGYAGSQRYGMIPWTGDVSRSFDGVVPQPEISLQMGMQGVAYMHSDLGGFAGGDSLDNELYTRWLQYGVFQPIYRPHAQEQIAPEPVFQNEKTKALVKKSIELRYKLKPYIYNMAYENSSRGKPLMIPLFFNEPGNEKLLTYDKAYMWGDAFLVSPIKERGLKQQKVYLPKGTGWTDFYTGKVYNGGKEYTISLTMDHIPVFVKGGAFIPMAKEAASEVNYSLDEYEVHYFVDSKVKESYYKLFNDDGKTTNTTASGDYEFMTYWAENNDKSLIFTIRKVGASEKYEAIKNKVTLKVHNLSKTPKQIKINRKKLKKSEWSWDKSVLTLNGTCSVQEEEVLIIK